MLHWGQCVESVIVVREVESTPAVQMGLHSTIVDGASGGSRFTALCQLHAVPPEHLPAQRLAHQLFYQRALPDARRRVLPIVTTTMFVNIVRLRYEVAFQCATCT